MPAYNVYLARLGGWEIDTASIASTLQGYFDAIVAKAKGFESAKVQWVTGAPSMTAAELLVYIVNSSSDSILAAMPGFKAALKGTDGTTFWTTTHTASEVYIGKYRQEPKVLANLAMHELMHNKTHLGHGLHGKGGMAGDTVTAASILTDDNASLMAGKLADAHTQWTDGFAKYNDISRRI